jgi:hypothetical protein
MGDWELIICDSYSKDGAWEFFQGFKDDIRASACSRRPAPARPEAGTTALNAPNRKVIA